jgi:hypothetical protein
LPSFDADSGRTQLQWPESGVLYWDGLLSLAFFLQHSGMVRQPFRARISGVIPPRYHRALYSIVSGIVLASVVMLWQRSEDHLVFALKLTKEI